MNRAERRKRGERASPRPRVPAHDYKNKTLADLRFDTPEASERFFDLPYLDDAYRGSADGAVRLPPITQSVSTTPHSGGTVMKAFAHGLMYADEKSQASGVLLIGGLWSFIAAWLDVGFTQDGFALVFAAAMCFAGVLLLRADLTGYRYNGVLLDRAAGQVHLFIDRTPWLFDVLPFRIGLWPLIGGGKCEIRSFDWRCVRAEVEQMRVTTRTTSRVDAVLRCVVTDKPGGEKIVAAFGLGFASSAQFIQRHLDTWEHVRRFMQREGPLFADEHDGPSPSLGLPTGFFEMLHWRNLLLLDLWGSRYPMAYVTMLMGIVFMPALIAMWTVLGVSQTIAWLFKGRPEWPAEILASVGGAELKGKDLAAWRNVVPEPAQRLTDAGPRLVQPNT